MFVVRFQRHQLLLLAILAIAVVLRLWGINYGLPFLYVTDEYHEVMRAMQLGAGSFNMDRTGKGGLYYLLFLEFGVYYAFLKLFGVVSSISEFAALFARDPSAFYLMSRATVLAFGVANVWILHRLTQKVFGQRAALIAAFIFALNVLHVSLSKTVRIDVVMTCLATLTLLLAVNVAERGTKKDYVLAAIAGALATTTKITAVLLLVPLLIAHWHSVKGHASWPKSYILDGRLWLAGATFVVFWFGTDPGLIFSLTDYLSFFGPVTGDAVSEAIDGGEVLTLERPNLFAYYARALVESMGWPLFIVSSAATIYALWRRTLADVLFVSFAATTYLVISSTTSLHAYFPRYVLPVIPVMAALSGRLLSDLSEVVPFLQKRIAMGFVVVLLALVPGYQAIQQSRVLTRTDTRTLAKQWIDSQVPQGAKVFVEGAKIAPVRSTVPIQESTDSMRERMDYWRAVEPRQATYLRHRLSVHDGRGFRLVLVPLGQEATLQEYRAEGVEFFVVLPDRMKRGRSSTSRSVGLLNDLRTSSDVELVATFPQEANYRPGLSVEIYRVVTSDISAANQGRP